jgi:hypothetical protein
MGARLRAWLGERPPELWAATFAALWFFVLGYGPTLDPRNIDWMFQEDWATYLLGFLFSRNAEWTLPLGRIPDWPFPDGTTTGFTDANPWASALFRLLSPWLPVDFQFAGMWFLLTFVLQAVFGAKITGLYTADPVRRALGGTLFALTPILPQRAMHVALSGIFFLTAGLWLALRRVATPREAWRAVAFALALLIWAAGTHGYLSVMTLALVSAFFLQLPSASTRVSRAASVTLVAAGLGVTLATYRLFGLIGWREMAIGAEGFGEFSADLLALVNPMGWSRIFGSIARQQRQYEGFAYLGLGVIVLLVVTRFFPAAGAPRRRARLPLCVAIGAMSFYALSSHVTLAGRELFTMEALYAPFQELTAIFRSSGRFLWPLHLALVAYAVSRAAAMSSRWAGRGALSLAILLQVAELDTSMMDRFESGRLARLSHPAWGSLGESYRHLSLHPLRLKWVCEIYDEPVVHSLAYLAYARGVTFDGGNVMRTPPGVKERCGRRMTAARFDPETVYVLGEAPGLRHQLVDAGARCGVIDGLWVCVAEDHPTPMLDAITQSQRTSREGHSSGGGSKPPG